MPANVPARWRTINGRTTVILQSTLVSPRRFLSRTRGRYPGSRTLTHRLPRPKKGPVACRCIHYRLPLRGQHRHCAFRHAPVSRLTASKNLAWRHLVHYFCRFESAESGIISWYFITRPKSGLLKDHMLLLFEAAKTGMWMHRGRLHIKHCTQRAVINSV